MSEQIPNPSTPATTVDGSNGLLFEIDGKLVPNYDATLRFFEEGDIFEGEVVRIDDDEVLLDIGYKSEGVIPLSELAIHRVTNPHEEVQIGDRLEVQVVTKEDDEGRLIVSKRRAKYERAWKRIEDLIESGQPIEGHVIEAVKGGLILDVGIRGFLPASLVDIRRVSDLDEYVGQKVLCKIIETNRTRNNVVLSRRAVLEEERKEQRQGVIDRLQPGLEIEGEVSNIVDFGAFVDIDGIDGLVHISELSWSHIDHPSEVVEIGDRVRVKILEVDRDRLRISLGMRQLQEDPWDKFMKLYKIGDEVVGKITKVVAFGVFVEVSDHVEGLVHVSEIDTEKRSDDLQEIYTVGDEVNVKVINVEGDRRRLSLSIKQAHQTQSVAQDLTPEVETVTLPEISGGLEASPGGFAAQAREVLASHPGAVSEESASASSEDAADEGNSATESQPAEENA